MSREEAPTANQDEEGNTCPICLLDNVTLARGRCQHALCLPCLERIMSAPDRRDRDWSSAAIPDEDAHLNISTRGRCPICRSELCLFDLQLVVPTISDNESSRLVVVKQYDISQTGLRGATFVQDRTGIGQQSLHFPAEKGSLPYVDLTQMDWKLSNGDSVPHQKYFETGCHFHEPTRTFHGTLKWGDSCEQSLLGSLEWEYSLAFSSNYRYITRGVVVRKKIQCQGLDCRKLDCKFPLDGKWKVTWLGDNSAQHPSTFVVHNNMIVDGTNAHIGHPRLSFSIAFTDDGHPVVVWGDNTRQRSLHNLREKHIAVGDSIEWEAATDEHPRMVWTCQTLTAGLPLQALNYGPDHPSKLFYHVLLGDVSEPTGQRGSTYTEEAVWGNTFCQGFMVGLASYHFLENGDAYISYEHEQTSMWPPLDNGSPIPSRIWFTQATFDSQTRTFCGTIDWEGTHHTTWQGSRRWRYKMRFAKDFSCIIGGFVNSTPLGSEVEMDMSTYGEELMYANVGLLEKYRKELDSATYNERMESLAREVEGQLEGDDVNSSSVATLRLKHMFQMAERARIRYPRT